MKVQNTHTHTHTHRHHLPSPHDLTTSDAIHPNPRQGSTSMAWSVAAHRVWHFLKWRPMEQARFSIRLNADGVYTCMTQNCSQSSQSSCITQHLQLTHDTHATCHQSSRSCADCQCCSVSGVRLSWHLATQLATTSSNDCIAKATGNWNDPMT